MTGERSVELFRERYPSLTECALSAAHSGTALLGILGGCIENGAKLLVIAKSLEVLVLKGKRPIFWIELHCSPQMPDRIIFSGPNR